MLVKGARGELSAQKSCMVWPSSPNFIKESLMSLGALIKHLVYHFSYLFSVHLAVPTYTKKLRRPHFLFKFHMFSKPPTEMMACNELRVCLNMFIKLVLTKHKWVRQDQIGIQTIMLASLNWNIFRDTGPLWGNSSITGEFPTKASNAELWCFLWSAPK